MNEQQIVSYLEAKCKEFQDQEQSMHYSTDASLAMVGNPYWRGAAAELRKIITHINRKRGLRVN